MRLVRDISGELLVFQSARNARLETPKNVSEPSVVDLTTDPPDVRLIAKFGAQRCVQHNILPWRQIAGQVIILAPDIALPTRLKRELESIYGPVRIGHCKAKSIQKSLAHHFGRDLAQEAEQRCPSHQSCRNWRAQRVCRIFMLTAAALVISAIFWPGTVLLALTGWVTFALVSNSVLKLIGIVHLMRARPVPTNDQPAVLARLPIVSVLVPLYHEREVADHIIARLDQLDYPRHLLDVCLIIEDNDRLTRQTLEASVIPDWAQIIEVPRGTLRTKPRALNYALTRARGSIIGIYDAEDIPAKDQLQKVVHHFAQRGPEVACLQGALDYFNPRSSWVSRCFTLEYATWFRLILPTLERIGCVIPLGGTTLFLRREAIEKVGGWDAHNVTEDADLGIRLAREGYRTEVIDTVTLEEANARPWQWVRQRSRWLKGYGMTWAVHMRQPIRLLRDLGPWRFFGLQMHFFGTLSSFALAPLLWSFWLMFTGLGHPLQGSVGSGALIALTLTYITCEVVSLCATALAARKAGKGSLAPWALTLPLYFPLATLAVYKALIEMAVKPFFWDKTTHGLHNLPALSPKSPPPQPAPHPIAAE